MNFFQKLLKFFSGFFPKSKKELSLEENDLSGFFEKESAEQRAELNKFLAGKFSEIKYLLKEIGESISEIEKTEVESENRQLGNIVKTSKNASLKQLKSMSEKLVPPNIESFDEVKSYCFESASLIEREISLFGRNIAYTSILLKEQMRKLGENVTELHKTFAELREKILEKKGLLLSSSAKKLLAELEGKTKEIFQENSEMESNELEKSELKKQLGAAKEQLAELKNSSAFHEIDSLKGTESGLFGEKQKLKTRVLELISNAERPLKKFRNLAEQKNLLEKNEKELLELYLANPFLALKRDVKAGELKKFLEKAKNAIESGEIELEEKEREKRINALNELISFDFFENVFWKLNQLDKKISEVEGRLNEKNAVHESIELDSAIAKLEREIAQKSIASKRLSEAIEKNRSQLNETRGLIEKITAEISGKKISIIWKNG